MPRDHPGCFGVLFFWGEMRGRGRFVLEVSILWEMMQIGGDMRTEGGMSMV